MVKRRRWNPVQKTKILSRYTHENRRYSKIKESKTFNWRNNKHSLALLWTTLMTILTFLIEIQQQILIYNQCLIVLIEIHLTISRCGKEIEWVNRSELHQCSFRLDRKSTKIAFWWKKSQIWIISLKTLGLSDWWIKSRRLYRREMVMIQILSLHQQILPLLWAQKIYKLQNRKIIWREPWEVLKDQRQPIITYKAKQKIYKLILRWLVLKVKSLKVRVRPKIY